MKKIIIAILSLILFIMILSILVIGLGDRKKSIDENKSDILKYDNYNINKIKPSYSEDELKIDVYISEKSRIDRMNIEDYVLGVLAAEMPAEFQIEALKAQAVAARTYGLAHKENFGGAKSPKALGADVNNTVEFQVFMYKEDRMKLWPEKNRDKYWEKLTKAVKETKGEVLTYNNELVMAPYYFSTSGGKTEDAVDVFNREQPYLKSVESPGEEKSPKYITEFKFSYSEFINLLNKWNPKIKLKNSNLKSQMSILERTSGGSVTKLKVGSEYISGQKLRSILNLNSANFTIKFNSKDIVVTCKGYGHGVGMSQWGANAMAKEGDNYETILEHYYQGVKITKLKEK